MRGQLCHCSEVSLSSAIPVQEEEGLEYADENVAGPSEYHTPPSGSLHWDQLMAGDGLEVFGGGALESVREEARSQLEDIVGWEPQQVGGWGPGIDRSCVCRWECLCKGQGRGSFPVRGGVDSSPSASSSSSGSPPSLENEEAIPVVVRSSSPPELVNSPSPSIAVRGQRAIRTLGYPKTAFHPYAEHLGRRGFSGLRASPTVVRSGASPVPEHRSRRGSRVVVARPPLVEIRDSRRSCCDRRGSTGDR